MADMCTVVAVIESGTGESKEYFTSMPAQNTSRQRDAVCEAAVRYFELTTTRAEPDKTVPVWLYQVGIRSFAQYRDLLGQCDVRLPLARMTSAEHVRGLTKLLKEVPYEFTEYISRESYEQGHSHGYEECISIAENMVAELKPVIEAYTKRVVSKAIESDRCAK